MLGCLEELMLFDCGVEEDAWESLGLQGDQTVNLKGNQSWIFIGRTDTEANCWTLASSYIKPVSECLVPSWDVLYKKANILKIITGIYVHQSTEC